MAQTKEKSFVDIVYKAKEKFAQKHTSEFTALINRFNSGDTRKIKESVSSQSCKAALKLCKKELEKSPQHV